MWKEKAETENLEEIVAENWVAEKAVFEGEAEVEVENLEEVEAE